MQAETGETAHARHGALEREHDLALELLLAVGQLARRQALARQAVVLRADRLDRLIRAGGLAADVDAEMAGGLVEVLVGEHGVGQPQLLAHPLEQAARHAAAEDVGQDGQREAPRILERKGVGAEHHVGLRRVPVLAPGETARRGGARHGAPRAPTLAIGEPPLPVERLEQAAVVEVAGRRHDAIARVVAGLMQAAEVIRRERRQRVRGAEDGVAVRVAGPEGGRVELEHEIVGRVLHAVDLLQNHVALGLQIALAQEGPAHQVGEDVHRQRQIGVEHVGLVAGGVPPGVGVETAAPDLELQRQVARAAPLGALEHHVLEQMGDPHLLGPLVRAGRPDVDPDGGRPHAGQRFGVDHHPVRRRRAVEPFVESNRIHGRATPWAGAPSGKASCVPARPPRAA